MMVVSGNSRSADWESIRALLSSFTTRSNCSELNRALNCRNRSTNSGTSTCASTPVLRSFITLGMYLRASMILLWKMASRHFCSVSRCLLKLELRGLWGGVFSRRGILLEWRQVAGIRISYHSSTRLYNQYTHTHLYKCHKRCMYIIFHFTQ